MKNLNFNKEDLKIIGLILGSILSLILSGLSLIFLYLFINNQDVEKHITFNVIDEEVSVEKGIYTYKIEYIIPETSILVNPKAEYVYKISRYGVSKQSRFSLSDNILIIDPTVRKGTFTFYSSDKWEHQELEKYVSDFSKWKREIERARELTEELAKQ